MSCTGVVDSLLDCVDDILAVRDDAGLFIDTVYFLTRTWSGTEVGDGTAVDTLEQLTPTPGLKDYSQDVRLREGGALKAGDIVLIDVSRNKYAETDLDASSTAANIEHFYLVGTKVYQVINLKKKYLTWDIQLRELTNQQRY